MAGSYAQDATRKAAKGYIYMYGSADEHSTVTAELEVALNLTCLTAKEKAKAMDRNGGISLKHYVPVGMRRTN